LGAVVVLFLKVLIADITHTRLERQVRRLNQRIALLEAMQTPNADLIDTPKQPI
jgi:hypothetical protein